jgi:hypothetical protein
MTRKPKQRQMDKHHLIPRSRGGTNHPHNLRIVEQAHHRAWHLLFGNMLPDEVASAITDNWISRDYYLVAIPRKKKVCNKRRKRRYCVDCECEVMKFIPQTGKEEK